jgi:hypothetical protein
MGLGLCLPHHVRRSRAPLGFVQHLMRQLMHQRGEGFRLRLTGQDGDAPAVAHAESGRDVIGKDKLDALTLDERNQTVMVFAHVAIDFVHRGKLNAFRLLDVKHIGGKLDKNFVGVPKEGYGASNNAAKKMRPPTFDEAKFSIDLQQSVEIRLLY